MMRAACFWLLLTTNGVCAANHEFSCSSHQKRKIFHPIFTATMGFMVVRFCVFDDRYQAGGAMMCPTQIYLSSPHTVRDRLSDTMKCHKVRYEYVSSTSYANQMPSGSYSFGRTVAGVPQVAAVPIHTFLDWIIGGDDWCLIGQSESVTPPNGLHITYTFQRA
jgi:hypothetical protein